MLSRKLLWNFTSKIPTEGPPPPPLICFIDLLSVHEISRTFEFFTTKTPSPWWGGGVSNFFFLGSSWHFPDFWIFDSLKSPLRPLWGGVGQICWARMIPGSTRTCVPNLVAVRRSCRKKGGTDRHTDTQTHTDKKGYCSFIGIVDLRMSLGL